MWSAAISAVPKGSTAVEVTQLTASVIDGSCTTEGGMLPIEGMDGTIEGMDGSTAGGLIQLGNCGKERFDLTVGVRTSDLRERGTTAFGGIIGLLRPRSFGELFRLASAIGFRPVMKASSSLNSIDPV